MDKTKRFSCLYLWVRKGIVVIMKKKILSLLIVSAMLVSSSAVFAEDNTDSAIINDVASEQVQQAENTFVRMELSVVSIDENGKIETTDVNGETVYINSGDSLVYTIQGDAISIADLKEGDEISVFVDALSPAILIYPPVYTASVIVKNDENYAGAVEVSTFTKYSETNSNSYISADKGLIINLPDDFEAAAEENDYLVFYTIATMSIPPQTPPTKVVDLNAENDAAKEISVADVQAEEAEDEAVEGAFVRFDLTVVGTDEDGKIETKQSDDETVYVQTDSSEFYTIKGEEINAADLKEGDEISVFVSSKAAVPAIYPAVIPAAVVVKNDSEYAGSVAVSAFTKQAESESYISADGELVINAPEDFEVAENTVYAVFYSVATKSIPPQTTPDKMIEIEYTLPVTEENAYEDVDSDAWYYESVMAMKEMGVFNGISDTEFGPELSLTRAMFVTILGRIDGVAVKDACATGFDDTPGDQYYSSYVAWANTNGIVKGYEDGTFKPDKTVSRQEAMQIILNYSNYKEIGPQGAWAVNVDYADAEEIGESFSDAAMWNVIGQYILADENNNIRPDEEMTRAEAAYAMNVLCGKISK